MLAVDGRIGFVTGLCVSRKWLGDPAQGVAPWRDTGIEVRGPAVAGIGTCCDENLKEIPMTVPTGTKNLGTIERVLRVLLGAALAVWASWSFLGGGALVWRLLDVALIALGVDFVVTGIRGYCPLYQRLGWSTARPRTRN